MKLQSVSEDAKRDPEGETAVAYDNPFLGAQNEINGVFIKIYIM